ncbi:acyclic terpene utilization AtuA family protein [Streptomyces sp. NPDC059255]|uniref:acyclic terpene utilization AtuA family protein n=1 Tax=Streptomyces sp. NPDC059255 TaxID=3346793 RepID=UPI00369FAC81
MTERTRVLVPNGMLGIGFPEGTVKIALESGVDAIAIDGGSTDSGPYYLGASKPKTARGAVLRDLRKILGPAAEAGVPVIIGSCGTSGTDDGVDWVAGIVEEIVAEDRIPGRRLARIYSEQDKAFLKQRLAEGAVHPLEPAGPLTDDEIDSCEHIVALMGHEPMAEALAGGANIVLAGRATDCAAIAVVPVMRGADLGPAWHAAKIAECGALCTTGSGQGGVIVSIDADGFEVEPVMPDASCTPYTVSAHLLYENTDPFRLREPAGTLNTTDARYIALDDRRVRVEGSRFELVEQHTAKLEGSAVQGAQTMSIVGLRDDEVLGRIDEWVDSLNAFLHEHIPDALGLTADEYDIQLRPYGWNAVLGELDPSTAAPREVGVVMIATAKDQAAATAVAKFSNPHLLHHPLPGASGVPSWSFLTSPAETERGTLYGFVLQHVVDALTPTELFRLETTEIN